MSTKPLDPAAVDHLREMYQAKVPIRQIMDQLQISRPTVYKYLHLGEGASRYEARPDHTVWQEAFDSLTDEAAYWVGLLITDGSVVGNGRRVKLSLQIGDTPTLERFRTFVRTSAQVGKPHAGSSSVRFSSPQMCRRLAELGVTPRKTATAEAPACLLHNRNFWRGVVDGDGSVFPNPPPLTSPGMRLCGASSAPLLGQWAELCTRKCGQAHKVRVRPDAPRVSDVIIYGKSAMIMAHWLYFGCTPESPAMDRKLAAYHQMCALHGGRNIVGPGKYDRSRKT
jgi:hypothetical protein